MYDCQQGLYCSLNFVGFCCFILLHVTSISVINNARRPMQSELFLEGGFVLYHPLISPWQYPPQSFYSPTGHKRSLDSLSISWLIFFLQSQKLHSFTLTWTHCLHHPSNYPWAISTRSPVFEASPLYTQFNFTGPKTKQVEEELWKCGLQVYLQPYKLFGESRACSQPN